MEDFSIRVTNRQPDVLTERRCLGQHGQEFTTRPPSINFSSPSAMTPTWRAAQTSIYQAVRSIDRFNGSCKVSVWLCQIAKHLWYQHLRK